jgi:hypothetical protein
MNYKVYCRTVNNFSVTEEQTKRMSKNLLSIAVIIMDLF